MEIKKEVENDQLLGGGGVVFSDTPSRIQKITV